METAYPGHRLEHFHEGNAFHKPPIGEGEGAYDKNDCSDGVAKLLNLKQQGGFQSADAGKQLIDAPQFGFASSHHDEPSGAAGNNQGSGIGHPDAIADGCPGRDGGRGFVRRN
jgi:hypothetical protein